MSVPLPQNFTPPAIPVARPRLPSADRILPYLQEIDSNGWYTNHGPLWLRFHTRLAQHWGLQTSQLALACNATAALSLALQASQVEPGRECLLPSWTFVATAGAVRQAGLVPYFVDVQPGNWAPDPAAVQAIALRRKVGAIMVVAPFGAPLDMPAWDAVAERRAFRSLSMPPPPSTPCGRDGPMPLGRCAAVVSLHATKVFGIGEGGALLSRDTAMMERFRRLTNFGFLGSRESVLPGVNAKISEYGAAIGLAALDTWSESRANWAAVTRTYLRRLRAVPDIWPMPGLRLDWVSSTLNILWPADRLDQVAALAEHGGWHPALVGAGVSQSARIHRLPGRGAAGNGRTRPQNCGVAVLARYAADSDRGCLRCHRNLLPTAVVGCIARLAAQVGAFTGMTVLALPRLPDIILQPAPLTTRQPGAAALAQAMADRLCLTASDHVLDLNCGAGDISGGFRHTVGGLVGVDRSIDNVAAARSRLACSGFRFAVATPISFTATAATPWRFTACIWYGAFSQWSDGEVKATLQALNIRFRRLRSVLLVELAPDEASTGSPKLQTPARLSDLAKVSGCTLEMLDDGHTAQELGRFALLLSRPNCGNPALRAGPESPACS